jgi:hypothetical protein
MINDLKHNTKLPETYHQAFLKEVYFDWSKYKKVDFKKHQHKMKLINRKNYLNKRFVFSKKNVLMFEILSNKLTHLQADIIRKFNNLEEKINTELISKDSDFIDFNIKLNIRFFCNGLDDDIDVLFESDHILTGNFTDEDYSELVNKNYSDFECLNEYKIQFAHFHQSRLFHHLIMESHLALQDILLLDEVWYAHLLQ